jgi:hypothetical protein
VSWLSAITVVGRLFNSLAGLFRDWRLRRSGEQAARLAGLEKAQSRAKRRAEIEAGVASLGDAELDRRMRKYRRAGGRLRVD